MRERPSSRLLVLDAEGRVLLFRFVHRRGPLAGQSFWATPGGGLDDGETFEAAACRELFEETGLRIADPGPQVARREAVFQTPDGDWVRADERFFLVRVDAAGLSQQHWSALEREVMVESRWWASEDLLQTADQVWPDDLPDILRQAVPFSGPRRGRPAR